MPLKSFYTIESDIPTDIRSHYAARDGKYVLQLEDNADFFKTGLIGKRDELLETQKADKREITRLTSEVTRLTSEMSNAHLLPAGSFAVPKGDAEAIEALKLLGNLEEIRTKIEEYGALKESVTARERKDLLTKAAQVAGYANTEAFVKVANAENLNVEIRPVTENGKTEERAFVKFKDGNNEAEKPLRDYVANTPDLKIFEPSFNAGAQITGAHLPVSSATGGKPKSVVDEFIEQRDSRNASRPNPFSVPAAASA